MIYLCGIVFCFVCCLSAMDSGEMVSDTGQDRAENKNLIFVDQKRRQNKKIIQAYQNLCKTAELKYFFIKKQCFNGKCIYSMTIGINKDLIHIRYDNGMRESFLKDGDFKIEYSPVYCIFLEQRYKKEFKNMNSWYRAAFGTLPDLFENVRPSCSM